MKSLKFSFGPVKSISAVLMQQGTIYLISLLTFGILARLITLEEMGVYGILIMLLNIIAIIGGLGLKKVIVRLVSGFNAKGDIISRNKVFWTGALLSVASSAAMSVLTTFVLMVLHLFDISNPSLDPILFLIALLFYSVRTQLGSGLEGEKKFERLSIYVSTAFLIRRFIALTLVFAGFGISGILIGWSIGEGIGLFLVSIDAFKNFKPFSLGYDLRNLYSQGLPLFIADLGNVLIDWGDRFIVAVYSIEWYALYYVAASAAMFISVFSSSIYTGSLPHLSEVYHSRGKEELQNTICRYSRYTVIFSTPIGLTAAALAYPLINLFVGPKYIEAAKILIIIGIAIWLTTLSTLIQSGLIAAGLMRELMYGTLLATSAELVAFIGLSGVLGLISAGVARSIFLISLFLFSLVFMHRQIGLKIDLPSLWKTYLSSILSSVVVYFIWILLKRTVFLPLYIAVGGLTYIISLRFLKLVEVEELAILMNSLPSKLSWMVRIISLVMGINYSEVKRKFLELNDDERVN